MEGLFLFRGSLFANMHMSFLNFGCKQQQNMLESDHTDAEGEAKLFSAITQFISIFREIIQTSESIIINLGFSNKFSFQVSLRHIKTTKMHLKQLLYDKMGDIKEHQSYQITYLRLASRLADILKKYKHKYSDDDQINAVLAFLIKKIEILVNGFKAQKQLRCFMEGFLDLSTNFCKCCQKITQNQQADKALDIFSKLLQQQALKYPQKLFANNRSSVIKENSPKQAVCNGSEKQKNQSLIRCLDIDQNYLSSMLYLAINQKDEMYRMMKEKNATVQRQIMRYSVKFEQFIRKKGKAGFKTTRIRQIRKQQMPLSASFKAQNRNQKRMKPLRINTQTSLNTYKNATSEKNIKQTASQTKRIKVLQLVTSQQKIHQPRFEQLKNTYFTFNPQVPQPNKCKKSRSHNKFRTIATNNKIYSMQRKILTKSKTPKYHIDHYAFPIQIKTITKNDASIQQSSPNHQSINVQSRQNSERMGGTTPKGHNGRIGDKRRIEKGKMKHNVKINCNISLEEKVNRNDPNSPVKKGIWLKQLEFI